MNAQVAPNPQDSRHIRDRFYRLVQAGWQPPCSDASFAAIDEIDLAEVPQDPGALWRSVAAHDFFSESVPSEPCGLAFHAPLGLTEGAWLQGLARADNAHRPQVAQLFAGYLKFIGKDESASPSTAYRGALARLGGLLPAVTSLQFSQDPRLGTEALAFASLRLELGWRAASQFAQALGFTLAYAGSVSPWRLVGMAQEMRQTRLRDLADAAFQALGTHLEALPEALRQKEWERVRAGYASYRRHEKDYLGALNAILRRRPSLHDRVAAILAGKAGIAKGYHGAARLGDKTLDAWFSEEPFDAAGFMAAFRISAFVRGEAGQRPFDRLTDFGGAMFGIFSRDEMHLIGAWLDQQQEPESELSSSGPVRVEACGRANQSATGSPSLPGRVARRRKAGIESRILFHQLLNPAQFPDAASDAAGFVERILRRAEGHFRAGGKLREQFFDYSAEALQSRVSLIHEIEVSRYKPFNGRPRLRREEYVFGIRQFAPAILADGCWLQRSCSAAQQDQRLNRLLLHIYADELGAGNPDWNHPNVYRRLLRQAGIDLPEVSEAAFAQDLEFLDSAFDLPVFLLGISQGPERWLPEILGLNLAIELSGLGAQYRFLADELDFWRLDSLIVRLHQSIDSLAGGHAALAVEAVQIHLEQVRSTGGEVDVAAHWRRVWRGYLSLNSASQRFRRALGLAFCRRFLPARLADFMTSRLRWRTGRRLA